ncbi:hypothetical protein [Sphingopyxis sp. EG6]|nr:hypothetical protein [Sphingopyxis sp. EG6]
MAQWARIAPLTAMSSERTFWMSLALAVAAKAADNSIKAAPAPNRATLR